MPVTPQDGASSVQACALRVARLAQDGSTPAGPTNMHQNKRFIKVVWTPVYETGEEVMLKTACGTLDVDYKVRDLLKRWQVEIELAHPDPEALELMTGGAILVDGTGSTIGYQAPHLLNVPNPNGCSLEVWERAILTDHLANPAYFRHGWPRVYLQMGPRSFENKANTTVLHGYAVENPNWRRVGGNAGPNNDFNAGGVSGGTAVDTSAIWQWIRDPSLPTPLQAGYQATPAQT